mmetsp:Transcript_15834/g.44508  ORF Transcript_15834/g.44508 Transcript_15834/m.44508 type:complete len:94 (-) Transcript_15834:371-652(-)|eukprot:scaffold304842_cov33-Tisochrysis_lutea.AAC.5
MLTVLINVVMWEHHASPTGIASLAACLLGGSLYQQAPLRKEANHEAKTLLDDEPSDEDASVSKMRTTWTKHVAGVTPSARCSNVTRADDGSSV